METFRLKSMTDFVIDVGNMENYPSHEKALSWIYNYATFLKQPLKLEMFVPCDEEGDILEKPTNYEQRLPNMMIEYNDEIYRYKQAKEKVLFVFKPHFDISVIKHHILQDRDIEYLANFGELELTENAIKQIGI